ncbi:MAG: winged helix DNA-binding domain-containing protein, partial [Thermoplasmata archaeon]|nr:winged helix DNA-binding domain-containing protein [Thermoplasmata archaeon]
FGRKHGSRMIFYLNQGTIPEEADYKVFSERGSLIGSLSEKFVERLSTGDIFVLGGRSYEFLKSKGTKAFVKNATGRKPTVPSWTGELLPRSYDLSVGIGRFRKEMDERLGRLSDAEVRSWLMEDFDVDEGSATTILNYFKEQRMLAKVPTDERLVVEGYVDASGNRNAIFHFPFGRRVNDALSRAYAQVLSQRVRSNVTVSVTDDNFMLTSSRPFDLESLPSAVSSGNVEQLLRASVRGSELFSQRFRHVATRSFMVLRNYKGRELSVARQQLRSQRLLDALHELEDFPVMSETYAEILSEVMDLENAVGVLASIESGQRGIEFIQFSGVPSPFAHNVVLVGVSDIVLMEDKSMLLRELHRKVLARVLGEGAVREFVFDQDVVAEYFSRKHPAVSSKHQLLESIRLVGPMNLFREKGESAFSHASAPFDKVRAWGADLLRDGKVRSVWIGEDVYVTTEQWPTYSCIHSREVPTGPDEAAVIDLLRRGALTQPEIGEMTSLPRERVKEAVRRLETSNAVHRVDLHGQSFKYASSPTARADRGQCLAEAVARHLSFHAPIGLADLAYEVGVQEREAEGALNDLLASERVVSGRFVVGDEQQYMLAEDYLRLQSSDVPVFDRETVRRYSEAKHFERLGSVRGYFEKYGEAGMAYDVFQRVPSFDHAGFGSMRASGDLVLGRFVRGRLRYVLADEAPAYLGVFRRSGPDKYEAQILKAVEALGSGTYLEVAAKVKFPPDTMRERFDSLDRKGYLVRQYDEAESWSSRSVYAVNQVMPSTDDPYTPVLRRYVGGNGPVTALQAASYMDVDVEDVRKLLDMVGAKRISVGLERTEMYVLADELPRLQSFVAPAEARMRILSLYDPFLGDRWAEITSRYGEGWIFPVILGGQMVGMIEKWLMAGSVEVRRIDLADPSLLGRLIDALDGMMRFYNGLGVDIIRVREFMGADAPSLAPEHMSEFTSRGYALINGMLVKGRVMGRCFQKEEVLRTVLVVQNLSPETTLRDMSEMLERYPGVRSDAEALARVERFESLSRLYRRGEVVRGHLVPDRVGYCTREAAGLFLAARHAKLNDAERYVLRVVRHQQPVKRDRLLELSPLGEGATADAIRSLYLSSRLYLDGSQSYVAVGKPKLRRAPAWARIIARLFDVYGVMSAESLATMMGHEIPMREVRAALRSLEDDGSLVKGFLVEGSTTLYWASKAAARLLGSASFDRTFVLSPEDNLTLYLRAGFREMLPDTGRHAVFRGPVLIGSFVGKAREGRLEVDDIRGDEGCAAVVAEYAKTLGLALREREAGRISDWEIMEFYKKTHQGG